MEITKLLRDGRPRKGGYRSGEAPRGATQITGAKGFFCPT
jgi:hypothetical protein